MDDLGPQRDARRGDRRRYRLGAGAESRRPRAAADPRTSGRIGQEARACARAQYEIVLTRSDVERRPPAVYQDLTEEEIGLGDTGAWYRRSVRQPAQILWPTTTTAPMSTNRWPGRCDRAGRYDEDALEPGVALLQPRGAAGRNRMAVQRSVLADFVPAAGDEVAGSWLVEGVEQDFVRPIADLWRVRRAYGVSITTMAARGSCCALRRHPGPAAGTYARRHSLLQRQRQAEGMVTFVYDTSNKYWRRCSFSHWLNGPGSGRSAAFGDLTT